jgi:hypothetical protein
MKTLSASATITLAAILILAAPARAQHTATLTWTNSVDTPQSNIYRAAGQCPSTAPTGFTKLNSTPVTTGTFSDAAPLITALTSANEYYVIYLNSKGISVRSGLGIGWGVGRLGGRWGLGLGGRCLGGWRWIGLWSGGRRRRV